MTDETRTPAFCTQCRSRCGCTAVVRGQRLIAIEALPEHPSGARLCPKGKAAPELVYHPDRLTQPMRRTNPKTAADPGWMPISWDEALDEIAARMTGIRDEHGPEQVAFSVTTPSGTHMSDGIAWVERLVRGFGSPNNIYGTEICNWHKDFATRFTYGHDIGTPDFAHTECIMLWGTNPANTWLARSIEIQQALRRGAKLIVIDPRRTPLARQADCWLRVKPGTDQALALGLINLQIKAMRFDHEFVRYWSNGPLLVHSDTGLLLREADIRSDGSTQIALAIDADTQHLLRYDTERGVWLDDPARAALHYRGSVPGKDGPLACQAAFEYLADAAAQYPPAKVATLTGVAQSDLEAAAQMLGNAASVAYYAWNGVSQSTTATQTDRAISLLYAITGHYGAAGGNVPGGAARFGDISGLDLLSPTQRAKALGMAERPLGPGRNGWVTARDVYRAILQQEPYPVRMLVSFGTNLLASQPDTAQARAALAALEFHVHADFFLNPSAQYADIVLPVATSWEREGLRPGFDVSLAGMRKVQLRPAVIAPVGLARSDADIALALADRLGMKTQFFGGSIDAGHDEMLAPAGLSTQALRAQPEGITLPDAVPLHAYASVDATGAPTGFPTPSRKMEIYSEQLHRIGQQAVPFLRENDLPQAEASYPLQLSGAKTMVYCHSQHRNLPSLRRLQPDPILEISEQAARERTIADRDWVRVRSKAGQFLARARISAAQSTEAVFAQHGWWVSSAADGSLPGVAQEDPGKLAAAESKQPDKRDFPVNMNAAIDTSFADPVSGSVPLRSAWCEVERIEADPEGAGPS